jgi:DNA-binding response OmpR family regulator
VDKKRTVLIVDDNPDIVALLRANLSATGFETLEAHNGEVALEKIDQARPDLVLLDLMMPVLDGWAVLEALRTRPHRPPVIVLTAADAVINVDRAQRLGVTAYVTKPFNLPELVGLVETVTSTGQRDQETRARTQRPIEG